MQVGGSTRPLRDNARQAVKAYLAAREDSYPWLFISQSRRTKFRMPGPLSRSAAHLVIKKYLRMIYAESALRRTATRILRCSIAKLINRESGRTKTAQEWLGHTSAAHTRAYIGAEDYGEKANEVVARLDI